MGEAVIGGDCVSRGYADDAKATARSFGPLDWLPGDLGFIDEDGIFFIMDRKTMGAVVEISLHLVNVAVNLIVRGRCVVVRP